MATLAPAAIDFSTSSAVWTPPVIAMSALILSNRIATQCRRSCQLVGAAQNQVRNHLQRFQVEVGLVEAVEHHQSIRARLLQLERHVAHRAEVGTDLHRHRNLHARRHRLDQIEIHVLDVVGAWLMSVGTK